MLVLPATCEAEAERSLEHRSSGPAWETCGDTISFIHIHTHIHTYIVSYHNA